MIRLCWFVIVVAATVVVEILLGRVGAVFAGPFFLCFYLVVTFDWRVGLICGATGCVLSEVLLGRTFTALPLLLLLVPFAHMWRRNGDRRYAFTQALPGAILGVGYAVYHLIGENLSLLPPGFAMPLSETAVIAGVSTVCAAFGLPLLIILFDTIAELGELPCFCRRSVGQSE
jgi:hypothetical protein